MFVSDAHLFVPREIRWKPILAIRFASARRRKRFMRRVMRDVRASLPFAALLFTFAMTVLVAQLATVIVPTNAAHGPMMAALHSTVALLD
jgi:hypothetical protein